MGGYKRQTKQKQYVIQNSTPYKTFKTISTTNNIKINIIFKSNEELKLQKY